MRNLILVEFLEGKDVRAGGFTTKYDALLFRGQLVALRRNDLPEGYVPLHGEGEVHLEILSNLDWLEHLLAPLEPSAFCPSEARFLYSFPPKKKKIVRIGEWIYTSSCATRDVLVSREEARELGIPKAPVPIQEVVTKTMEYLYYLDWKEFHLSYISRKRLSPGEALLQLRVALKEKMAFSHYWKWLSRPEVRYIQKHRMDLYEEKEFKPHPRIPRTFPEAKHLYAYLLAVRKLRKEVADEKFVEFLLLEDSV